MSLELELACYICLDSLSEHPDTTSPIGIAQKDGSSLQKSSTETSPELCATPCGHVFHRECVLSWIQQHKTCPNCRRKGITLKSLTKIFLPLVQRSCKQCKRRNDSFEIEKNLTKREMNMKINHLMKELESKTEGIKERDNKLAHLESELQEKVGENAHLNEVWIKNAATLVEQEKKTAGEEIKSLKRRIKSLEYRYKKVKLQLDSLANETNKDCAIVANVKNSTNKTGLPVLEVDLCDSDDGMP